MQAGGEMAINGREMQYWASAGISRNRDGQLLPEQAGASFTLIASAWKYWKFTVLFSPTSEADRIALGFASQVVFS
jgi:hypothetical protein